MSSHRIELVYFHGCPHVDEARSNVRQALLSSGGSADWIEWDLLAESTPDEYRIHDSPTVLIDGEDVAGLEGQDDGLACRVEGAPSTRRILNKLRRKE